MRARSAFLWMLALAALAPGADGGIAGLQTWFRRKFPSAFEPISEAATREYDHVLVDMNQVLHHAVRKANDVEHAKILVFMELNLQFQRCVPRQSVVLAFDGPGPRAKLLTQRRRRAKRRTPAGKLSSMLITPGSDFMSDLLEACTYYACRRLQNDESFQHVTFWMSGSQVAGEGEVKIIDWLNVHMPPAPLDGPDTRSVCVIGSDVDLVLQCISALPRLMSGAMTKGAAAAAGGAAALAAGATEGGAGAAGAGAAPLGKRGGRRRPAPPAAAPAPSSPSSPASPSFRFEVLTHSTSAKQPPAGARKRSVPWLRISVLELAGQLEASFPRASATQLTHDLTALLCMFGNDYLPRLRGCTLSVLYESYLQLKRTSQYGGARGLIDAEGRTFDLQFLGAVMRALGSRSHEISHVSAQDLAQMRRATDQATVFGSVFAMKLNECAHVLKLAERPRYADFRLGADAWTSKVHVGGKTFAASRRGGFKALKHAQWDAARFALADLCPERHAAALAAVELSRRRLSRYGGAAPSTREPAPAPAAAAPARTRRGARAGREPAADTAADADDDDDAAVLASAALDGASAAAAAATYAAEAALEDAAGADADEYADNDDNDDDAYADDDLDDAARAGESGELGELFDVRGYLSGVLWTVQMYIDGLCPDYTYAYGARLAPSPAQVCAWLDALPPADARALLFPPVSEAPPPTPAAVLASLVPIGGLGEVAPQVERRLSAETRALLAALEADEERSLATELEIEERGKRSLLETLQTLMASAEADALHGLDTPGAQAIGAACMQHWQTIARDDGAGVARHALPRPPTARSVRIKPYGLLMKPVRATLKPPCRKWGR